MKWITANKVRFTSRQEHFQKKIIAYNKLSDNNVWLDYLSTSFFLGA